MCLCFFWAFTQPGFWCIHHESQRLPLSSVLINEPKRSYSSKKHAKLTRGKHLEMESHHRSPLLTAKAPFDLTGPSKSVVPGSRLWVKLALARILLSKTATWTQNRTSGARVLGLRFIVPPLLNLQGRGAGWAFPDLCCQVDSRPRYHRLRPRDPGGTWSLKAESVSLISHGSPHLFATA